MPVLDRRNERLKVVKAIGWYPRVLVYGAAESCVRDFATWVEEQYKETRLVISWDFESAPGVEGIDILRDLARKLPHCSEFESEYRLVVEEFAASPPIVASQNVGGKAKAQGDQAFTATINVPGLTDHVRRNLYRLAEALFKDICVGCENDPRLVLLYGVIADASGFTPTLELLNVFISSFWRLSLQMKPKELCVVLAATTPGPRYLGIVKPYFPCALGKVRKEDIVDVFVEEVPGLTKENGTILCQAFVPPDAFGLDYSELRDRVTCLMLNRLEEQFAEEAVGQSAY
jgi:hypothetical protein